MLDELVLLWEVYPEWQLAVMKIVSYLLLWFLMIIVSQLLKSFRSSADPPPFLDRLINTATLILLAMLTIGSIVRLVKIGTDPLYLLSLTHWIVYGAMVLMDVYLLLLLASALWGTRTKES